MELTKELGKLKSYFGVDLEKFKAQRAYLKEHFSSVEETKEISDFIEQMTNDDFVEVNLEMQEAKTRYNLIMNKEIIPFSYIAKNYFHKSSNWIYQRLNGNKVNGKEVSFTPAEYDTLRFALTDISKKLGSVI